ncbi:Lrp/AsnC family leucine-responsive transcriptional regulator [Bacillus thuringiensis]|uniref:Lrp/AsnC family leucine-responsive transcriptional regulator n=1 Tax=Bacillus thuringiensis TaxID=1428 RepID=A0A4R4B2M3_BACTU|nr:Lrp/AsnC family transcriptional regulator [Bacillus thuringiensis]TCW47565.1 Lrp/AsnC family leucine-responsive transcriptional regulator [Bacillus thuringiensis]TCW47721.1 Lrp/AsnC family leucine-responsive transcriptional regulator [Bacillus thuringiensis]
MKTDQMDLKILEVLTRDPRISMRELAKKVNLSAPSVAERVRNMESHGIIEGYTTKINYKKLGFTIEAIINITVKNGNYERFKTHIKNYAMVDFCYRISGQSCYMAKIVVRSLEEIEEFIDSISELAHTVTYVVFSEVNTIPKFLETLSE